MKRFGKGGRVRTLSANSGGLVFWLAFIGMLWGTVKLRPCMADWANEKRHAELPRISISARNHQPRRLAVPPFLSELSRC